MKKTNFAITRLGFPLERKKFKANKEEVFITTLRIKTEHLHKLRMISALTGMYYSHIIYDLIEQFLELPEVKQLLE